MWDWTVFMRQIAPYSYADSYSKRCTSTVCDRLWSLTFTLQLSNLSLSLAFLILLGKKETLKITNRSLLLSPRILYTWFMVVSWICEVHLLELSIQTFATSGFASISISLPSLRNFARSHIIWDYIHQMPLTVTFDNYRRQLKSQFLSHRIPLMG
jgi:hypothetical protein